MSISEIDRLKLEIFDIGEVQNALKHDYEKLEQLRLQKYDELNKKREALKQLTAETDQAKQSGE